MDARRPCPDSALLAAFLDGTLGEYERTAVVTHLADCAECRAVALTVVEFREVQSLDDIWQAEPHADEPPQRATRVARWTRQKTRAPSIVLGVVVVTAAAVFSLSYVLRPSSSPQPVSSVIAAAAGQRSIESRVVDLPFAPLSGDAGAYQVEQPRLVFAANRIREAYVDDYAATSRGAVGVAALLTGRLDEAVTSLVIAADGAPQDARLANDLAAALYERAQRSDRPDDLPAALNAVERAIALNPDSNEAWFNRALIVSALGLRADSDHAWQEYIRRDPFSAWTEEARTRAAAASADARPANRWIALRDRALAGDLAAARLGVSSYASRARDFIEGELLARWVAATSAADQRAVLGQISLLADAFASELDERLYQDFIEDALRRLDAGPEDNAPFIAAHQHYTDAMASVASEGFVTAVPSLERARAALRRVTSPFEIRVRLELVSANYVDGRVTEALAALPPLLSAAREKKHRFLVVRARWLAGLAEYGLGDFAGAQVAYEDMLNAATAASDAETSAMANVLLANLHWTLGDLTTGWRYRLAANRYLPGVVREATLALVLLSAAGDAQAAGYDSAALVFHSAILGDRPLHERSLEVQGRTQRAASLSRTNQTVAAQSEIDSARQHLSGLAPLLRARIEADLLGVESEVVQHHDPNAAMAAAARALTFPFPTEDFQRLARLNLRLADASLAAGQTAQAEQAIAAGLDAFEALRNRSGDSLGSSDPAWALYRRATEVAARRGDLARAFEFSERRRVRTDFERRRWGTNLARLGDIQQRLDPHEAMLILNQLSDHLQVWVVRRDNVSTYSAPISSRRASALVASHLDELARTIPTPAVSGQLFDLVVHPGAEALAGVQTVVVVADAPYDRIGYAGLWNRRRDRFFVEDYSVVAAPSATAYAWADDRRGVGSPSIRQASLIGPRLPDSAQPRRTTTGLDLTDIYETTLVRAAEVTTADDLMGDVGHRDVVHVAAPVRTSDEYPAMARLQIADEPGRRYSGSISARRIAQIDRVRAQLVALDGGSTSSRSESALGVARALLVAGVPSVVGAVAGFNGADVNETWLEFHRQYASGAPAAESLRRAQLAALSAAHRRPGPWATLTVFGSDQ